MATIAITKGYNDPSGFTSGETITPAKLNSAQSPAATISDIVNADIKSDAAIAHSKLANITAGQVLLGNSSNVPTATALSGDVTVSSAGVTAIGNAKVTPAMLTGGQSGSAPIYGCRAWVNFRGTASPIDVRGAGNVSSIGDNGVGNYSVNFTTNMQDTVYAVLCVVGDVDPTYNLATSAPARSSVVLSTSASTTQIINNTSNGIANDYDAQFVAVIR
jgi:hypothetical protein